MLPTLTTGRLVLRPFTLSDAPRVQQLAGDYEIARNTLLIPHPYPDGLAESWIAGQAEEYEKRGVLTLAVEENCRRELIGSIGLTLDCKHNRAEMGYWIGRPYWGQGFASEAAVAVVRFGLVKLALHRIEARHFTRNPASGRVLQKAGMQLEGIARGRVRKGDEYLDVAWYAILQSDRLSE